jgi:cytochrome c6
MKKILVAAVALSLASTGLAAVDAAALYASKCAVCHGKDGAGTPAGKKMGAPDLVAKSKKESEKEIVKVITNGEGKMTGFKGKLTPEEIDALAKYVKAGLK